MILTLEDGTQVRSPDPVTLDDELAVEALLGPPGAAVLGAWGEAGGPSTIHAAYELLRRQVNGLTGIVDATLVGHRTSSYAGNVAILNRGLGRSILGQHLVDPPDGDDFPVPAALTFLQSVRAETQSVEVNRPAFIFDRTLVGDAQTDRPLIALRKRLQDGATDTGPWIMDDREETWAILDGGTIFSRGGFTAMGNSANIVVRGGSAFVEFGGVIAALSPGVTSDDSTGSSIAIASLSSSAAIIGDLYGGSMTLYLTGTSSAMSAPRFIVAEIAAPAAPSAGFGTIYEKADGLLYFKNDAGTEYDLTATGAGGSGNDQLDWMGW